MTGSSREQHDAVMAKLRKEGRLGEAGQVRLVPLSRAAPSPPPRKQKAAPKARAEPEGSGQPWSMDTLYRAFDAAGVTREDATDLLRKYRIGRGIYDPRHIGPFLVHEPFVRTAVERGEDVPREILEFHPHLLPEANLLHGIEPASREATLLREARALDWISFNDSRESFSTEGRWYMDRYPQVWSSADVSRTAPEALKKVWQRRHDRHTGTSLAVLDQDGPWTLAEQRQRLEALRERLATKYRKLGLREPKNPLVALGDYREREAEVARENEKHTIGLNAAVVRLQIRQANAANARREYALDAARYNRAAPRDDSDRSARVFHGTDTRWANESLNNALGRLSHYGRRTVQDALQDKAFMATIDPYVKKKLERQYGGEAA